MPKVTFITPDASPLEIEVSTGTSIMEAAIRNNVGGIVAECGGNAMCATCHVYVEDGRLSLLPTLSDDEDALLDSTAAERRANSRLSCQISMTAELDGLVVTMPAQQI